MMRRIVALAALVFAAATYTTRPDAYVTYGRWGTNQVLFYINPKNADVSESAAEAALKVAMNAWSNAGSSFRYQYGGRVSLTTTGYDNRNLALFRNATNGSSLATTRWWLSSATGRILDADIIFWDAAWRFFTGSSGCASGAYIEDVGAHEFGHALGLRHSAVTTATMYSTYKLCTQSGRTLDADDIAGVRFLYGGGANTAPVVSTSAPLAGLAVSLGTPISFAGSASDGQDGNLTPQLVWTSSIDGHIGTGGSFSKTLSAGVHAITAKVTDSGGLTASRQVPSISVLASTGF